MFRQTIKSGMMVRDYGQGIKMTKPSPRHRKISDYRQLWPDYMEKPKYGTPTTPCHDCHFMPGTIRKSTRTQHYDYPLCNDCWKVRKCVCFRTSKQNCKACIKWMMIKYHIEMFVYNVYGDPFLI